MGKGFINFTAITLFSVVANAQSKIQLPVAPVGQGVPPSLQSSISTRAPSQFKARTHMQHYSYISANKPFFGREEKSDQLTTVGVGIEGRNRRWDVQGLWFYVPQEDSHYFDIPEMSYTLKRGRSQITLGRHLHEWSQADEFWGLAVWQPEFLWNPLEAKQQGLTGVFLKHQPNAAWQVTALVSDLFVPNTTPRYREEDGVIKSNNPWFRTPPRIVELWEQNTPVVTRVNEPDTEDVIFQPSAALQIKWQPTDSFGAKISYAHKPMNSPRIGYNYFIRTPVSGREAHITVNPEFLYHHVATLETSWGIGAWTSHISLTTDRPIETIVPLETITQGVRPADYASALIVWQPNAQTKRGWRVYAGAIKAWSELPADEGENAQADTQFELRVPYWQAYRLGVENNLARLASRFLNGRIQATYDIEQKAGLFLTSLSYGQSESWQVHAQLDLIGATSEEKNQYERGFLRTYKSNDNFSIGWRYVY